MTGSRRGERRILEHLAVKRDPTVDAAYLALTDIEPGAAVETVQIHDRAGGLIGAMDLDADGCVLGIEFLNADRRLPGSVDP